MQPNSKYVSSNVIVSNLGKKPTTKVGPISSTQVNSIALAHIGQKSN